MKGSNIWHSGVPLEENLVKCKAIPLQARTSPKVAGF
jgi:hypothetical protein